MEERIHHHREAVVEASQLSHRGAEVEAVIQEHPWHHLAEAAVGEPFRQAVVEEVDQSFHPGEAAVEEQSPLAEVEVEEPSPLVEVEEEESCLLAVGVG